jgi:hypothetical protein
MVLLEGTPWCRKHMHRIDRELQDMMIEAKEEACIRLSGNPYIGGQLLCGGCSHQDYMVFRDGEPVGYNEAMFYEEVVREMNVLSLLETIKNGGKRT